MHTIGLIIKPDLARRQLQLVRNMVNYLLNKHKEVMFDTSLGSLFKAKAWPLEKIMQKADLVIVLGGDGTILKTARLIPSHKKTLILSVNMGKLGFLTDLDPDQTLAELDKVLVGKYHLDSRFLLRVTIYRSNKKIATSLALNEVVINQGGLARLLNIRIEANQRKVSEFAADGLIIATPTGSTGHALSAGGPIIHPALPAFVLIPLCPTTLSHRPIIIPNNRQLKVIIYEKARLASLKGAGLTIDGQIYFPLQDCDQIKVRASKRHLYLIRSSQGGYYKMLRKKLGWGEA